MAFLYAESLRDCITISGLAVTTNVCFSCSNLGSIESDKNCDILVLTKSIPIILVFSVDLVMFNNLSSYSFYIYITFSLHIMPQILRICNQILIYVLANT